MNNDKVDERTSLGKRKELESSLSLPTKTEESEPMELSSSPLPLQVDAAFERMFGYSWEFANRKHISSVSPSSSFHKQLIQIFGPLRTSRILKQLSSSSTAKVEAAVAVTTMSTIDAANDNDPSMEEKYKKIRLEKHDYKNIELPKHMTTAVELPVSTTTSSLPRISSSIMNNNTKSSNLDEVLKQIAGKKQINTVEKSSKDWEGFKETDKTLQDDLERTAQSKNAYLVKQDFLNRVDQRKFELEKNERDLERSRRAPPSIK